MEFITFTTKKSIHTRYRQVYIPREVDYQYIASRSPVYCKYTTRNYPDNCTYKQSYKTTLTITLPTTYYYPRYYLLPPTLLPTTTHAIYYYPHYYTTHTTKHEKTFHQSSYSHRLLVQVYPNLLKGIGSVSNPNKSISVHSSFFGLPKP